MIRLVERKFGSNVAGRVAKLLSGIHDPHRLRKVADWIIDCDEGGDLVARLEAE